MLLSTILDVINELSSFVWGPMLLIPALFFTGVLLTVRLKGLQFRKLYESLYLALVVRKEEDGEGDISHFEALMTALSATVGTGNIVGVATAIGVGGPGALFWMWVTGLLGMATKYSEALLSVKYRSVDAQSNVCGGPMYYLRDGLANKKLGSFLGMTFALFGAIAAFGIGNLVQSNAVAQAVHGAFGVPNWISGVVIAVGAGLVILGGIRSIGRFTGVFVPVMIVAYLLATIVVLCMVADQIPAAFGLVFEHAFTGTAAAGGFAGATVWAAIRFGVARGIFSNESGLGSAGIAAAAAQTQEPVRQAMVSMTQTFIDTLVVCTGTGIAIVASGAWSSDKSGVDMTQLAFTETLGQPGAVIVAVCLSMFAFSTILGWCYYGEKCVGFLLGESSLKAYRLLFVFAAFYGTIEKLDVVWSISDVMNGLMALPNLVGLVLLSGVVVSETQRYFSKQR